MKWKAIGQSTQGVSHILTNKDCEDAIKYGTLYENTEYETLICCLSDGAGSAVYAKEASQLVVIEAYKFLENCIKRNKDISEVDIYEMLESLIDKLNDEAIKTNANLNEFSCTLLGGVIFSNKSIFFQIGDGAIVCLDDNDNYYPIWFPQNGEYQNTTWFLIDYPKVINFHCTMFHKNINEVAMFTDGLQLLALNYESYSVHQPFFFDMFKWLRKADNDENISVLNTKLKEYLNSKIINDRTDDDKTLFLATRIDNAESQLHRVK